MTETTPLHALALVCSLEPAPGGSQHRGAGRQVLDEPGTPGVTGDVVRVVDHDVAPGIEIDRGDGGAWPAIRERMTAAGILVSARSRAGTTSGPPSPPYPGR